MKTNHTSHQIWGDYYLERKRKNESFCFWFCMILLAVILILSVCTIKAHAEIAPDYYLENDRIVEAIYKAEGGARAKKPFGVLSVPCNSYQECRQICLNTVRNNKKRYADYGHKTHESFIEFLASRYAPVGVSNDPNGLNRHWIKNVRGSL